MIRFLHEKLLFSQEKSNPKKNSNKQIKMTKACIHDNGEDRCVAEEGPHCICRLSAFVLSNGFSLALFVGRVIDANVIIQKNEKEKMI